MLTREQEKVEKIKKEMSKYDCYSKSDIEKAVEFVEVLLEIEIEDTQKHESYATRSISDMKTARDRVVSLYHAIGDLEEL